jgi:hypothetical protein
MLTSNIRIGKFFQANIYSYVAHDCIIGDYVTLAPKVCCNGRVKVGDHVYIGTGAIIKNGTSDKFLTIGEGAIIGAGAVVTKDVLKHKISNNKKEGFTPANTNYGQSSPYLLSSMGGHSSINTNNWNQKDLSIVNGKFGSGVSDILDRPKQQIPLPEGELDMFANTQFKPECCKNNPAYSLSTGCACMTTDQYNYLATRGGNNVPYSEY